MLTIIPSVHADAREPQVHPSFPDILRQLTARDAKLLLLTARMQRALEKTAPYETVKIINLRSEASTCGFDPPDAGASDFYVSAETLIRVRFLEPQDVTQRSINHRAQYAAYIVTNLGWAFLRAVLQRSEYEGLQDSIG